MFGKALKLHKTYQPQLCVLLPFAMARNQILCQAALDDDTSHRYSLPNTSWESSTSTTADQWNFGHARSSRSALVVLNKFSLRALYPFASLSFRLSTSHVEGIHKVHQNSAVAVIFWMLLCSKYFAAFVELLSVNEPDDLCRFPNITNRVL